MTTATEPETKTALQRFNITDSAIAKMRDEYLPLKIDGVEDKAGFDRVHKARMVMVKARTTTDKVRKELNAEAKKWIDTVNGEAKRITSLLEPIETHLVTEEQRIEAEAAAIRFKAQREAEEKKRQEEEAERARVKAAHEAENARLSAIRAELARQAEEAAAAQRKQEESLAAQRAEIEASRRKLQEAQEAERKRLVDAEAARLRKIEEDRQAAEEAAKPKPQTTVAAARADTAAFAAAVTARLAEQGIPSPFLQEDRDKIMAVASCLRGIDVPMMATPEGIAAAARINAILDRAAAEIRDVALTLAPAAPASEAVEEDSCPF